MAANYSTWYALTNRVLENRGLTQITSTTNFDNPITNLTRVQSLARAFVSLCDEMLNVHRNNRDTVQEFQIVTHIGSPTTPVSNYYTLDASISVENLRYLSFFNTTPANSTTGTVSAFPLRNMEYREFRNIYPDFTSIETGSPEKWIIIPKTLINPGAGIVNDAIMFYPVPDAIYSIVYQAKTNATPLELSGDKVLWTQPYEHILLTHAGMFLEDIMGQNKGALMTSYAQKALSEYNFWLAGPDELRHAVRTGMQIGGLVKGRRVSPYSDTTSASS